MSEGKTFTLFDSSLPVERVDYGWENETRVSLARFPFLDLMLDDGCGHFEPTPALVLKGDFWRILPGDRLRVTVELMRGERDE